MDPAGVAAEPLLRGLDRSSQPLGATGRGHIGQPVGEPEPLLPLQLPMAELADRLGGEVTKSLVVHLLQRGADHLDVGCQFGQGQVSQAGQQFALGQVSAGSEQDDDVRGYRLVLPEGRNRPRRRVGDGLGNIRIGHIWNAATPGDD